MPTKSNDGTCPHCGQRMLIRHGIKLTPMKADIFDMIANATRAGRRIDSETLSWVFYPGIPRKSAKQTVATQVCQMNDLFASTDIHIDGGKSGYQVRGIE